MLCRMKLIDSPPGDPRPRWRGTGWDRRPGGMTFVNDAALHAAISRRLTYWDEVKTRWRFGRGWLLADRPRETSEG